jgi:hypothetical protein
MKFTVFFILCIPLAATTAQVTATGSQSMGASVSAAPSNKGGTYINPELHLTFSYPPELRPEDARAIGDRGHLAFYGTQPGTDPEHIKSEACDKVLFMVGKGSDPKKAEITIARGKKKPSIEVKPDPGGSIALFEIDNSCIPPKLLKKPDSMLAGLAHTFIQIPGLKPIGPPLWYEIQGHRVHFAAAQRQPLSKKDNKPLSPYPQIVGGFAVEVDGHVLFWMLQSNDVELFNHLLDSQVDFGPKAPQALFPSHLQ